MPVTHIFVNPIADEPGFLGTKPSDWNDVHTVNIVNADVDAAAGIVESKLSLNFPTHAPVTLGVANGLSLSGQQLSMALAGATATGTLSALDWNTFNNKVPSTRMISGAFPIFGGGDLSQDRTLFMTQAGTGTSGYLSSTDFNTFSQSSISFPLTPAQGGTGKINTGTFTNNSNLTVTGGGTIILGGFTLTVPATGTAALLAVVNAFTSTNIFSAVSGLQAYTNGITTNFLAGLGAGNATMTGVRNVLIGNTTGDELTDGEQNVCIGHAAGTKLTTGDDNMFIGFSAGRDCVDGVKNVCIGSQSGLILSSGTSNMLIGQLAGSKLTTALMNVMIGQQAGTNATSSNNVMIGSESGRFVTSGASNIFIGLKAGYRQTTLSNLLIIDNQERASAAVEITNAIFYGVMASTPASQTLRVNAVTSVKPNSALTTTISTQFIVGHNSTGTPAAGFGLSHKYQLKTSTTEDTDAASWEISHVVATHASRTERIQGFINDSGGAREWIRGEASGTAAMLSFYGGAAVVRGAALTTQLTTITHTSPGTPDYAIQDLTNITPYGFATQDEGNTVLSVIRNLQLRVAELEARLGSATGVNLFA